MAFLKFSSACLETLKSRKAFSHSSLYCSKNILSKSFQPVQNNTFQNISTSCSKRDEFLQ